MNSGELKVDVPLADAESDYDEGSETNSSSAGCVEVVSKGRDLAKTTSAKPDSNIHPEGRDSLTGSLEDLVNSFDEKLKTCFQDYQEQVEKIAPVQVRSHEEIMNECQVWWTITGNFGNMMPIDWSKSTARANQLSALNLGLPRNGRAGSLLTKNTTSGDEDDVVAADLDMHSLILSSHPQDQAEPVKTADEVLKEIDEIMNAAEEEEATAEDPNSKTLTSSNTSCALLRNIPMSSRTALDQTLRGRTLDDLPMNKLTQILSDIELLVKDLSEELVADLGVRDELEYEKELKNTFISLLLSIQNRRRACDSSESTPSSAGKTCKQRSSYKPSAARSLTQPQQQQQQQQTNHKYLTTIIPYQPEKGTPPLQALQVLVKILKAINEDSPAVPALLTDYILKVLCPS